MGFWTKWLPMTSFVIASTALSFQTMVLYPWHHELDKQFKQMLDAKKRQDQQMKQYNQKKMQRIIRMQKKIQLLINRQEEQLARKTRN